MMEEEQIEILKELIDCIKELYLIVLEEGIEKIKTTDDPLPTILKFVDKQTYKFKGKVKFDIDGDESNKEVALYIVDEVEQLCKDKLKQVFEENERD